MITQRVEARIWLQGILFDSAEPSFIHRVTLKSKSNLDMARKHLELTEQMQRQVENWSKVNLVVLDQR